VSLSGDPHIPPLASLAARSTCRLAATGSRLWACVRGIGGTCPLRLHVSPIG